MLTRTVFPLLLVATFTASSQIIQEPSSSQNRFGLSYRAGFNVKTSFKNVGRFGNSNPGTTDRPTDHTYDDGFNLVDSTGNDHFGQQATWNWGYSNDSQYDPSGTGTITMNSSSSVGGNSMKQDDLQSGFELTYNRELIRRQHWRAGFEGAFNYMNVSVNDSSTLGSSIDRITDVYQLNGVIPPAAPHAGSFNGPGALLGDTPSRSQSIVDQSITGTRRFEADLFGLRLGSYLEIPVHRRVSVMVSGGMAIIFANSTYSFDMVATTPDPSSTSIAGSSDHDDILFGGYVSGNVSVAVTERWSVFAGAQFVSAGTYTHPASVAGGGSAVLDLGQSIFVTAGVGFSF